MRKEKAEKKEKRKKKRARSLRARRKNSCIFPDIGHIVFKPRQYGERKEKTMEKLYWAMLIVALVGTFATCLILGLSDIVKDIKKPLGIAVVAMVLGFAITIITPIAPYTVMAEEVEVVAIDNVGYCTVNADGQLKQVASKTIILTNKTTPVLVRETRRHQFLCFAYCNTESHLEIPKE